MEKKRRNSEPSDDQACQIARKRMINLEPDLKGSRPLFRLGGDSGYRNIGLALGRAIGPMPEFDFNWKENDLVKDLDEGDSRGLHAPAHILVAVWADLTPNSKWNDNVKIIKYESPLLELYSQPVMDAIDKRLQDLRYSMLALQDRPTRGSSSSRSGKRKEHKSNAKMEVDEGESDEFLPGQSQVEGEDEDPEEEPDDEYEKEGVEELLDKLTDRLTDTKLILSLEFAKEYSMRVESAYNLTRQMIKFILSMKMSWLWSLPAGIRFENQMDQIFGAHPECKIIEGKKWWYLGEDFRPNSPVIWYISHLMQGLVMQLDILFHGIPRECRLTAKKYGSDNADVIRLTKAKHPRITTDYSLRKAVSVEVAIIALAALGQMDLVYWIICTLVKYGERSHDVCDAITIVFSCFKEEIRTTNYSKAHREEVRQFINMLKKARMTTIKNPDARVICYSNKSDGDMFDDIALERTRDLIRQGMNKLKHGSGLFGGGKKKAAADRPFAKLFDPTINLKGVAGGKGTTRTLMDSWLIGGPKPTLAKPPPPKAPPPPEIPTFAEIENALAEAELDDHSEYAPLPPKKETKKRKREPAKFVVLYGSDDEAPYNSDDELLKPPKPKKGKTAHESKKEKSKRKATVKEDEDEVLCETVRSRPSKSKPAGGKPTGTKRTKISFGDYDISDYGIGTDGSGDDPKPYTPSASVADIGANYDDDDDVLVERKGKGKGGISINYSSSSSSSSKRKSGGGGFGSIRSTSAAYPQRTTNDIFYDL